MFFAHHRFFVTFDFKAYYYQFKLSQSVARNYVGRISGDHTFRILRPAMGHKNSVFVAQSTTSALAQVAIAKAQRVEQVTADVIIDNVCFASNSLVELRRVAVVFRELCAEASVEIGEEHAASTEVTHRGLLYDSASGIVKLKPSWRSKFITRVDELLRRPSFEKLRSVVGMLAYLRIYFAASLPKNFFVWKALTRWAAAGPSRRMTFSPVVELQLRSLQEFVSNDPQKMLGAQPTNLEELLVTDACKDSIFAGWGAVWISGERVEVIGGRFPLFTTEPICVLEMRAIVLALQHWRHISSRRLVVLTDNTASLFAIQRGYSPSWPMQMELDRLHRVTTERTLAMTVGFIPSKQNPADAPSRGELLIDEAKIRYARMTARRMSDEGDSLRRRLG
jgi:hypothetical protein